MKKIILLCLLLLFTTSCTQTTSSNSTSNSPQTSENKETPTPVLVDEWSGVTDKSTQSFVITADEWYISWAFYPDAPSNYFSIEVWEVGSDFFSYLIANIANSDSNLMDTSYIHSSGNFYLTISCLSGEWTVEVYDYR